MDKPIPPPVALALIQERLQEARIEIAGLPRGTTGWVVVRQKIEALAREHAQLTQICLRFEHQIRAMYEMAQEEGAQGGPYHIHVDPRYPTGN